jgi:hypothetical protein
MNSEQITTLDQHFTRWEVESAGGELRYQATPRGSIIGFYGYADTYDKAYQLLMRNATKDNHNNCRYCAAGEAYNHNPEEVKA